MKEFWNADLFYKVVEFAMKKHDGQIRMMSNMPYIGHVFEVFGECTKACLQEEIDVDWNYLMMVALLHDTLEDTDCSYSEISAMFGKPVADGVMALTKNTSLDYEKQIEESLTRIVKQPKEVSLIKMADRIVNMQDTPVEWSHTKRKQYKIDAVKILNTLGKNSKILSFRLQDKINKYEK